MNKSDNIASLAAALSKAQAEMPAAQMNATNPFLKNKYADLGSVIETARPVLAKHGLSVVQLPIGDGGRIGVETVLLHESGEWVSNELTLDAADEKGKSAAQVAGSIISYLRRYSLSAALGIYADEDTDGNKPQPKPEPAPRPAIVDGEPVLTYQDGSTVTVGSSDKAKAEQTSFADYVKAHDGQAPKNVHNLRNWIKSQKAEN